MTLYALNLFDLADNDLYRRYSRRSPGAVAKHGGRVVALGRLENAPIGDAQPRSVRRRFLTPAGGACDARRITSPARRKGEG
jgi:uncharacterized protein (DUF1330 family)